MIEKIYSLSKSLGKAPAHVALSRIPKRKIGYAVLIDLDSGKYEGVRTFEIGESNADLLLFRETPGNHSTSKSPSINLQKAESVDRVVKKFINFFDDSRTWKIHGILKEFEPLITEDIRRKEDTEKAVLTILVKRNEKELFPSQVPEIRDLFVRRNTTVNTKKHTSRCFLCGKKVPSFPILSEIFKFATFDKPAFTPALSGRSEGVVSICKDCRISLEHVRRRIEEYLEFNFFGDKLWIIPSGDSTAVSKIIERLKDLNIFSREDLRYFRNSERAIERILKDGRGLNYDFVVLRTDQSAEKILLHMSYITPSRLSKIVIEGEYVKERFGIDPTLAVIGKLFSNGKKSFYELVRSIYTEREYPDGVIKSRSLEYLRRSVKSEYPLREISSAGREVISTYAFLINTGVIKGGKRMEDVKDLIDSDWKRAVFLTGALTSWIMDFQKKEKGSSPFVKKLKNLKMREEDVKDVFTQIKAKEIQYGIEDENFSEVMRSAAESFIRAGKWNAGIDEINFVFALGMAVWKEIFKGGIRV